MPKPEPVPVMKERAAEIEFPRIDLERFDIVDEVTGRERGRVFSYRRYLAILSEGTEPLPLSS